MTTRRDDWRTPLWLFRDLDAEFHFICDVAATAENALCERFLSDALTERWPTGSCFMNPPYGAKIEPFLRRAAEQASRVRRVVVLIPVRAESPWWHDVVMARAAEIRFIRGRLAFRPPAWHVLSPRGNRPVFASAIVIFDGRMHTAPRIRSLVAPRNDSERAKGNTELPWAVEG